MQDTINDAMDMALKLAQLLTQEQRIKHNECFPEDPDKPVRFTFTTVNREYKKLCGVGGETIKAFKALIKAIEPEIEIELLPADDTAERKGPRIEVAMIELLTQYVEACTTFFVDPVVTPAPGGFHITTSLEVPPQMRAACERIFFNIGRSIRERAALTWEVI